MSAHSRCRHSLILILLLGALAPGLFATQRARAFTNGQAASLVLGQTTFTTDRHAAADHFYRARDIAIDPTTGSVFVADNENHRVLRFSALTSLTNGTAAESVLGQPDFVSHAYASGAQGMYFPEALTVDTSGRLWVADTYNNRVLRFDNAANKANGAAADGVLGQINFTNRLNAAGAQQMFYPGGVAVDAIGTLWVSDKDNNRILRFDGAANKVNGAPADGILGQPDFANTSASRGDRGLHWPRGITVDESGHLWVADYNNNRVLRFDNAADKVNGATADSVLGQENFDSAATATSKRGMWLPRSVAVDTDGRLWVADGHNSRVLRFDNASSKSIGADADSVLGQQDFTSKIYATTAQSMFEPSGVEVDNLGRLWIADAYNNRVLRFDTAATKPNGAPADGVLGHTTFTQQRSISASSLDGPQAVAVDPTTGKVFVADTNNNRVLRYAARADLANGAPAQAVLGQPNFTSRASGSSDKGLFYPTGLTIDPSGRLWVADKNNNRVLRFDNAATKPNGSSADGVLGQPDFTSSAKASTASGMRGPMKMATDSSGRLWVADSDNARVLRFDNAATKPNGAPADGVLGQPDFTSQTRATTAQGMNWPVGLAVDSSGRLWVGDGSRVVRFENAASKPNGVPADGVLGQLDFTSTDLLHPTDSRLYLSMGVAVDSSGRLWVADRSLRRALRFDNAAAKPNGAPADGVLGKPNLTTGAGGGATAQNLSFLEGISVDPSGAVWVADTSNNRVLLFKDETLLRLPEQRGSPGQVVRVPVSVDQPVTGLIAASLSVSFDPAVLRPHGDAVHPSTLTPGWLAVANSAAPGLLQLDLISPGTPASGTGTLAELEFEIVGPVGSSTPLAFSAVSLNDGDIPAATQAGTFRVEAASYRLSVRATHATTGAGLPATAIQISGPATASCQTGPAGDCALPGLPAGAYTLALTKGDEVSGITSYDASLILQHTSGQRSLTGPAFTAADTNGNGQVTSFDAALVLQYTSGQRALPFPAGPVWKFAPPSPLALDQDREVTVPGVLIGDVSGHLTPALLAAGAAKSAGALQLIQRGAPDAQGFRTVELWLEPAGQDLLCLEATLAFDPARVTDLRVAAGPSTGALFAASTTPDGKLRVALASATPLPGGSAVTLRYRADGADGLTLTKAETNEGGTPAWLPPTAQDWQLRAPLVRR